MRVYLGKGDKKVVFCPVCKTALPELGHIAVRLWQPPPSAVRVILDQLEKMLPGAGWGIAKLSYGFSKIILKLVERVRR